MDNGVESGAGVPALLVPTVSIAGPSASLPLRQKLAYSVGHVLNDLCASMWFTYLLLYFHSVLGFSNSLAGMVMLVGQVADALATPFVGIESDRTDDFFLCRYGRRKTWHLFGTICVVFAFPFLFTGCLGCDHSSPTAQLFYYSAFVVLFQFGWAATQISHLSLIPDLSADPHERTELNALRYAFTVLSNICVYSVTWVVLGGTTGETSANNHSHHEHIGPEDKQKFQNIVMIVTALGATQSLLFHLGVREKKPVRSNLSIQNGVSDVEVDSVALISNGYAEKQRMEWQHWFKEIHFYQVGFLYMFTRLFVNLAQVYIPLYLQDTLHLHEASIAIIPLVMYVSGFSSSFLMKLINKHAGRELTYAIGALLGLGACIWIYVGRDHNYAHFELYGVAVLLGISGSTMLITSLSITADLIGNSLESGAFVYGAMSFTDKLSNGVVVVIIQYLHPCQVCCHECDYYYRLVLSCGCGISVIAALLSLLTLLPRKFRRHNPEIDALTHVNEHSEQHAGETIVS